MNGIRSPSTLTSSEPRIEDRSPFQMSSVEHVDAPTRSRRALAEAASGVLRLGHVPISLNALRFGAEGHGEVHNVVFSPGGGNRERLEKECARLAKEEPYFRKIAPLLSASGSESLRIELSALGNLGCLPESGGRNGTYGDHLLSFALLRMLRIDATSLLGVLEHLRTQAQRTDAQKKDGEPGVHTVCTLSPENELELRMKMESAMEPVLKRIADVILGPSSRETMQGSITRNDAHKLCVEGKLRPWSLSEVKSSPPSQSLVEPRQPPAIPPHSCPHSMCAALRSLN